MAVLRAVGDDVAFTRVSQCYFMFLGSLPHAQLNNMRATIAPGCICWRPSEQRESGGQFTSFRVLLCSLIFLWRREFQECRRGGQETSGVEAG